MDGFLIRVIFSITLRTLVVVASNDTNVNIIIKRLVRWAYVIGRSRIVVLHSMRDLALAMRCVAVLHMSFKFWYSIHESSPAVLKECSTSYLNCACSAHYFPSNFDDNEKRIKRR